MFTKLNCLKKLPLLLVCIAASFMLHAQQSTGKVSGVVTSENGDAIVAATVSATHLKSKKTYTAISDSIGKFTFINLPLSGAYSFTASSVGYESRSLSGIVLKADEINSVIISLKNSSSSLGEVVVVGYGTQTRDKVVGAVGKIKSDELLKVAAPSAELQLAGKMSGVVINQGNGQPGAGAQIVIRGTGTLTAGAEPLIVVDGFPLAEGTSLSAVNPNDIKDIDVLKDAASAAIYGSRAANGVILITTKMGKRNAKTSVSFSAYAGVQQVSTGVKQVDAYQFAQFLKEARDWGYVSKDPTNRSKSDPNSIRVTKKINGRNIDGRELILDNLQPYLDGTPGLTNTNWIDEALRKAPMQNYDLSVSGGNEKTAFYTSVGYFNQDGIVLGTGLKRYSAAINLESKISNRVKVGFNIKPSYYNEHLSDQSSRSSGTLALINLNFPFYPVYKADGSLNISEQLVNETRTIEGININGTPVENLVATALNVTTNKLRFKTFGNVFLDAEIIKGLTYRLNAGGDYEAFTQDFYYPSFIGFYRVPAPRSDANGSQIKNNTANYLIENTFTYQKKIDKHHFNLLAGYTFQKRNNNRTTITGTKFADDNIQNIAGASLFSVLPQIDTWTLESYLSRLQYDYNAKYLFSGAIRTDGSSRFGINNRWGIFPSLSAGWVLSKESFFPKSNVLNFAKFSASWGKTGNNQIGVYGSQALVTNVVEPSDLGTNLNYVLGNTLSSGYITTTAPNPDLGWEIASSKNLSLDLGLFSNKLNAAIAWYQTNTTDLLLQVPVPQQTGYDFVLANIGEMQNKGFEFQLSGSNLKVGGVTLGINTNLTTYSNKVLALGPGQTQIATGLDQNFVTKVGRPIAEIYGYNISGVYKTQQEIDNTPHIDGTLTGDYIVEDVNKDGMIDVNDKVIKGTYAPKMTYGFGADAAFKGFTFSFNFMGVAGRTLLDGDMSSLSEAGEGFAVPTTYYFENRYHPINNPDGFLGQPNFANFSNARKLTRSSIVVQKNNGDYLRLRDVRLSYDFSPSILKKISLSQLQLYVSANNLFTITKFRGWNPDGTHSSDILQSGFTNGSNYPIAKSFLFGLRITY